jgi:beta-glucosidase
LGLFKNPYPQSFNFDQLGSEEVHKSARNVSAESIVLLKNKNRLLPLNKPNRLTVVGMNADSKKALCGGWSYSWQGDNESIYPDSINTVFDALNIEFDNTRITNSDRAHLRYYAGISDAIIVVTGESPYAEGLGNIDDMSLPEGEMELIEAALATNKPVILILLEGRPRILGELFDQCHAVLFAGLPGMFGGEAIAGILSGRINPSGKMPVTYPYKSGHMLSYNYKHSEFSGLNAENPDIQRFSIGDFGYGLSFTRYEYSNLTLSDSIITIGKGINVTVKVKNVGSREGKESVLWFLADEVGTYTRPVKQLKHFEKQFIMPGEVKEYSFSIDPVKHLGYPDMEGNWLLESGYYTLLVGQLSVRFRFVSEE